MAIRRPAMSPTGPAKVSKRSPAPRPVLRKPSEISANVEGPHTDDRPAEPLLPETDDVRPTTLHPDAPPDAADLRALPDPADPRATAEAILFEVRRVIVGQDAMLERILVGLLSGGHLLLEGVPGLAKTLTIKTLADVLGGIVQAHPVHART